MIDFLFDPFLHYAFMRRALAACAILSMGSTPLGIFLNLRRMTLMGDAMSHAILPGVAIAFSAFGLALIPMTMGGLVAGALVALSAILLTKVTKLKEDASFTMFYLLSVSSGVIILSLNRNGNNVDLLHMLFGNILAIDNMSLLLIAIITSITLFTLAFFYRGLVIECFDAEFAQAARKGRGSASQIFFVLLVINLIAAFQALGTLMALGLMILPAIAARFWTERLDATIPLAIGFALVSSFVGLLFSYYGKIPSGPAVVVVAGIMTLASVIIGRHGSLRSYAASQGR